jgi:UDP-N-acetylmuramyl pentapeptide phosphotransferase/UDP-N-acetylglucosamine-1-phosphate transferase
MLRDYYYIGLMIMPEVLDNFPVGIKIFVFFLMMISCMGYAILIGARGSKYFRKLFFIPANKAQTSTLLLGGIPVNVACIFMVALLPSFMKLTLTEERLLYSNLILLIGVLFYGYLDDRFEIRPIVKLCYQVFIVLIHSIFTCKVLYSENSAATFLLNFFFTMAILNGVNLLDGLDTLTSKIFAATLSFYLFVNFYSGMLPSITIVVVGSLLILLPFYILNRAPAKVYIGEIGTGTICSIMILLSGLTSVNIRKSVSVYQAMAICLIPLSLSSIELGVSFIRRILNRKSPFKGDRLHIHHILNKKFSFKSSSVGTIYGLLNFLLCVGGYFIAKEVNGVTGFLFVSSFLLSLYFMIGRHFWVSEDFVPINFHNLFNMGLEKKVKIISDTALNDFQIHLIKQIENQEKHTDDKKLN